MNNDLISREALKEDLAKEIKTNDMGLWLKILLVIDNAPTVEQPQGEWIEDNSGDRYCSECGNSALLNRIGYKIESQFCPYCGAKMKQD